MRLSDGRSARRAPAPALEVVARNRIRYRWALTAFEAGLIMLVMVIIGLGPEAKIRDFPNAVENNL